MLLKAARNAVSGMRIAAKSSQKQKDVFPLRRSLPKTINQIIVPVAPYWAKVNQNVGVVFRSD